MDLISIIIISAIAGSFLNMLVYRLNNSVSLIDPLYSACPNCKHKLNWQDLIPVISYLLLRGRCRYCKNPINFRYLLLEVMTVFCGITGVWFNLPAWSVILNMVLSAVIVSDWEYQEIPYAFSGAVAALVLLSHPVFSLMNILTIAIFAGFVKLLEKYYYHREIFGGADLLLFLIFGWVFPFDKFLLFFYSSFGLGLLVIPFVWLKTRSLKIFIPFAPLIVLAYWLTSAWGEVLIKTYWSLFNV